MANRQVYLYKGNPYEIAAESKAKIDGIWIDVIIYRCLYINPDGQVWVRTKEEFESLFEPVINQKNLNSFLKK